MHNGIILSSMIFSIISILITILSIKSKKQILASKGYDEISFSLTGQAIISKTEKCRNQTKKIRNQLSKLLGLEKQLVEVLRPQQTSNGIKITISIHVNGMCHTDSNYKRLLHDAQHNGQLKKIVSNAWDVDEDGFMVYMNKSKVRQPVMPQQLKVWVQSFSDTEYSNNLKTMRRNHNKMDSGLQPTHIRTLSEAEDSLSMDQMYPEDKGEQGNDGTDKTSIVTLSANRANNKEESELVEVNDPNIDTIEEINNAMDMFESSEAECSLSVQHGN